MNHRGDFDLSAVIYGKFTTFRPSTGAAYTLAGSPALSVYKDSSTTQSTSGVTLTADFDSVTGLNHFAIDTSSDGTFYSAGSFFDIVITTGTVDGVSVVGAVVGSFTLRKNSALKPTTAGRTLDVASTGEAGIDLDNVLITNGSPGAGVANNGTLNGTHSSTTADLGANAPAKDIAGMTLYLPAHNLTRTVDSYNTATGVATFATTTETLANGDVWFLYPTPPSSGSTNDPWTTSLPGSYGAGTAGKIVGDNLNATVSSRMATYTQPTGFLAATFPSGTVANTTNITAGTITTVTNLTNAPTAGDFTATMKTSIGTAVAASAVASVTGNVGGNVTGSIGSLAAQAKADVNAEVVDGLNTDTYAEPAQGAPGATVSLVTKIGFLYKAWRNKTTQTATAYNLYNDDSATVDHKATLSDDATTMTRTEIASGP